MILKYLIIIISSIIIISTILIFVARKNMLHIFHRRVNELFSIKNSSSQNYNQNQIQGLPLPVQRYFKFVLNDGQPYINSVRITHDGKFKPGIDKDWLNIKGEQYAITYKPGFIWKGTTRFFTAQDMYINDKGNLIVSLLSLYKIIDAKGEKYDQGELLRWLAESVFYPTNLLPSENLNWFPINDNSAKLIYNYNGLSLFLIVTFNSTGEIIEMETKRYMDTSNLQTWIIKMENYKTVNNVKIPTSFNVLWRLEKGDFSYAKFNLIKIEYNVPKLF